MFFRQISLFTKFHYSPFKRSAVPTFLNHFQLSKCTHVNPDKGYSYLMQNLLRHLNETIHSIGLSNQCSVCFHNTLGIKKLT